MSILLAYVVFCILLARRDAHAIKRDGKVYHDNNLELHGVCFAVVLFSCFFTRAWLALPAMIPLGKLAFDVSLNLWRGKKLGYVSDDAKAPHPAKGASVLDWYEWHLFKSGITPKVVYLSILITLIFMNYESS